MRKKMTADLTTYRLVLCMFLKLAYKCHLIMYIEKQPETKPSAFMVLTYKVPA